MATRPISQACHVENGKLFVHHKRELDAKIAKLKAGDYTLRLERQHAKHSDPQRGYYYAVVLKRVMVQWNTGTEPRFTKDLTHETLKAQFLPIDAAERGENGTVINGLVIGGSLSKLNKVEMADYLDRIIDHAAANWNCYIPPPNPDWREQAEEEVARDPRATMLREKGAAA